MAYVNFCSENDQNFISIQHNASVIKLDMNQFSNLMLNLRALENEIIRQSSKSKQNDKISPKKTKIVGSQSSQFKKRMKKMSKLSSNNSKFETAMEMDPNSPTFETLASVYAENLPQEINSIAISQCVGCMLGKDTYHDICINKPQCIEDFFYVSMCNLDKNYINDILCNTYGIVNPPKIEDLLSNKLFVESVKAKLATML
jgi:hypothetical protein